MQIFLFVFPAEVLQGRRLVFFCLVLAVRLAVQLAAGAGDVFSRFIYKNIILLVIGGLPLYGIMVILLAE